MEMYDLELIKAKTSLVAVAQSLGLNIRKAGDRCVSPLRPGATNPTSFRVGEEHWFDYGSGRWGDAIDLLAEVKYDSDKGKAIRELARQAGIEADEADGWRDYTQRLNNEVAFYQQKLTHEDFDYLHRRGLTDETISELRIGRNSEGRLVIPYIKNGYVAYYCTRALPGCKFPDSKYRKMPIDTHNANIVWGWDSIMRGGDTLVIAEGAFDAISFWQEGYPVLSAITGFFSHKQLADVLSAAKQFKRVFFVYDNDKVSRAGEKFAEKMARILLKERIDFIVGHVPDEYKDVSEYYEAGEILQTLVNNAINGISYLCNLHNNIDDLSQFLRPLAREYGIGVVEKAISDISERSDFSAKDIKELSKRALTPPSELEIARVLIRKRHLIYLDSAGFYEWDKRIWKRITDNEVRGYAAKELGEFATAGRSINICNQLKAITVNNGLVFDKQPVVTFPNGTLELETGLFREPRKEDYCTICMTYDYNPSSICPVWERFIHDITDGCGKRYENLQFIPGYALMPHCDYQKIFIFLGSGGNGKSIYLDILKHVFGRDNVSTVEPSSLPQDFQRITIKDSLLNVGSDISSDFTKGEVREWLLKIAGGEMIQACYKGKDYIKFEPRCKLVFACNTIPTAEVVNGLERRFQFVEFPCRFVDNPDPADKKQKKRDVNIMNKLLIELPGIFNWIYKGYKEFKEKGWIVETDEQERLLQQFKTISNPVEEFCDDKNFAGEMTRDEIYSMYRDWCENAGHKPLSRTKFLPKFREKMERQIVEETQARRNGARVRVFKFNGGVDYE